MEISSASLINRHKYGPDAGHATALLGGSVRNVAVVYIDVRGVGRRALLKSSAKGFVKAKLKNGQTVKLQGDRTDGGDLKVEAEEVIEDDDGTIVVGMPEVGMTTALESRDGQTGLTKR